MNTQTEEVIDFLSSIFPKVSVFVIEAIYSLHNRDIIQTINILCTLNSPRNLEQTSFVQKLNFASIIPQNNDIPRDIPYDNLPYCQNISTSQFTGTYTLCWGFFGNLVAFSNTLRYSKQVWVGVGFHEQGSQYAGMEQGDFVVATFNSTGEIISVDDRYCACPSEGEPQLDTQQGGVDNILEFGGYQKQDGSDWLSHVYFSRYVKTGDEYDHDIGGGSQNLIWAHGTGNVFSYHSQNKGEITLDLTDPYNN